jgi:hypothetical protein
MKSRHRKTKPASGGAETGFEYQDAKSLAGQFIPRTAPLGQYLTDPDREAFQGQFLAVRFGLPPSMARTVAALAWGVA